MRTAAFLLLLLPVFARAVDADPAPKRPAPSADPWKDGTIQGGNGEVIWADGFGPFVAVGRNTAATDARVVWNLAERKPAGKIAGRFEVEAPFSLSPSGKYLACGRGFAKADMIAVFDVAKGKALVELKNPERFSRLEFLADDKLAVFADGSATVWDIAAKKTVVNFKVAPSERFMAKLFVTPTGKLVGQIHGEKVKLFDPKAGEVASYPLPKPKDITAKPDDPAVNPDGKTLAVLWNGLRDAEVLLLDLTTGEFRDPIKLPEHASVHDRTGRKLAWSLDGEVVLALRRFAVDPKANKVIWQFPEEKNPLVQRGLLSAKAGLYFAEAGKGLEAKAVEFDDEKLAAMRVADVDVTKVAAVPLPKLTETNAATAREVVLPATWAYTAKVAAAPAAKIPAVPVALEGKVETLGRVLFADRAATVAVEVMDGQQMGFDPTKMKAKAADLYDLDGGRRTKRIALGGPRPVALSADGGWLAAVDGDGRIDLFETASGEPKLGFAPFGDRADKKVGFAAFVGSDRLLTAGAGRVVVWSLPAAKPEARFDLAWSGAAVAPAGDVLALADAAFVRLFDAATLNPLGALPVPPGADLLELTKPVLGFSADGTTLVAAWKAAKPDRTAGVFLAVWNLADGKPAGGAFLRGVGGWNESQRAVEFAGPGHVLIDGTHLVSVEKAATVWTFSTGFAWGERPAVAPRGGRHWAVVGEPFKEQSFLVPADVAGSKAFAWVKEIDGAATVLWAAGTPVRLNAAAAGDGGAKALAAALDDAGFLVKDDAPNTLTVTSTTENSGKTQEFRDMGPRRPGGAGGGGTTKVEIVKTTVKARLEVGGKAIWEAQTVFDNSGRMVEHMQKGEDLNSKLTGRMEGAAQGWASQAVPPRKIVQTRDGVLALPGRGTFTSKGLEILPPLVMVK